MSSRLSQVFARCKEENRSALVGYLTAGDPDVQTSEKLMLSLAEQVDIIEIGIAIQKVDCCLFINKSLSVFPKMRRLESFH